MLHIKNGNDTYITLSDDLSFPKEKLNQKITIFDSLKSMNEDMETEWGMEEGQAENCLGTYIFLHNGEPVWQRVSKGDRIPVEGSLEDFVNNLSIS
jgi:hypothetical protein